jgi:hypothetical protein
VELLRTYGEKVPEHIERFRFFESLYAEVTNADQFENMVQTRKFDAAKNVLRVKNSVNFQNLSELDADGSDRDDGDAEESTKEVG